MRVGVSGASGVLGRALLSRAAAHGLEVAPHGSSAGAGGQAPNVLVHATPAEQWRAPDGIPSIAPAVRQQDAAAPVEVSVAGFWGGLGTLLASVATDVAGAPRELHVAYGFPGGRRAFSRASSTLRRALVRAATDDAVALVGGTLTAEPLGEGRRLAWFPAPVGPAHAVAVGGLEHLAPLGVPTVRTWLAARSMTAELLQAVGRWDPARGPGALLERRAARAGGGPGATDDLRWAVVVEALERDGSVVRAWANGTDPVRATADLLLVGAQGLDGLAAAPTAGTLLDLAPATEVLDRLADLRTLRWSVSRPEPSQR